jgi:hypothetical protein
MAHRMSQVFKTCPDACSGRSSDRQGDLAPGELESIPEPSRTAIKSATRQVRKCGYCGCVYSCSGKVFGTMDSGVTAKAWEAR